MYFTYGSLMDILTCEVNLYYKLTKGEVTVNIVFVHVSRACCMLDNAFSVYEDG